MLLADLASLTVNAEFEAPVSDESYPDPSMPAPLKEGTYRFKVVDYELDKGKDGSLNLTDGKWPVLLLKKVEVVEPQELAGRTVGFQRIYTKEFPRDGGKASMFSDLVRAHNQSLGYNDVKTACELLDREIQGGTTFRAKVMWTAYDRDHADSEYAKLQGGKSMATKEQHNRIRKEATVKGMTKFPKNADGSYASSIVGKSGATIDARAELNGFIPSNLDAKIG